MNKFFLNAILFLNICSIYSIYSMEKSFSKNFNKFTDTLSLYSYNQNDDILVELLGLFESLENEEKVEAYEILENLYVEPQDLGFEKPLINKKPKLKENLVYESEIQIEKYNEKIKEKANLEKTLEDLKNTKNNNKNNEITYEKLIYQNLDLKKDVNKLREDVDRLEKENIELLEEINSIDEKINQNPKSAKSNSRANVIYRSLNKKLIEEIEELERKLME